jgi:lipopolysaccharide export LptBFGC system permease protein LptF
VTCLVVALLASGAEFVNLGWATPASNQRFRQVVSGGAVEPGIGELPLGQLVSEIERFNHDPAFAHFGYLLALLFAFHSRMALSLSPLIFVFFAFSMLPLRAARRWIPVVAACVAFFSYYMFFMGARGLVFDWRAPAYVAAWLPNAVTLLIALGAQATARRRDVLTTSG